MDYRTHLTLKTFPYVPFDTFNDAWLVFAYQCANHTILLIRKRRPRRLCRLRRSNLSRGLNSFNTVLVPVLKFDLLNRVVYKTGGKCAERSLLWMLMVEDTIVRVLFSRRDFTAMFADEILQLCAIGDLQGNIESPTGEYLRHYRLSLAKVKNTCSW